jgi:hypothetical protein
MKGTRKVLGVVTVRDQIDASGGMGMGEAALHRRAIDRPLAPCLQRIRMSLERDARCRHASATHTQPCRWARRGQCAMQGMMMVSWPRRRRHPVAMGAGLSPFDQGTLVEVGRMHSRWHCRCVEFARVGHGLSQPATAMDALSRAITLSIDLVAQIVSSKIIPHPSKESLLESGMPTGEGK